MSNLTFSQALTHIKAGIKMQRVGWNGKGMWVTIQRPDEHSKMSLLASQTDVLAEDWQTAS
jgi:phosphoribosylaminoimidazole carboxylase (NCAIR synthetase)